VRQQALCKIMSHWIVQAQGSTSAVPAVLPHLVHPLDAACGSRAGWRDGGEDEYTTHAYDDCKT
jgi:hypothetical protein